MLIDREARRAPANGGVSTSSATVSTTGSYVKEQLDAAAAFEELAAVAQKNNQAIESLDRYEAARRIYAVARAGYSGRRRDHRAERLGAIPGGPLRGGARSV